MLNSAHQGYIYQDILGAYFVAQELAAGRGNTRFQFDCKKTPKGIPDKFDDLVIYREESISYIQIKYSNDVNTHALTKEDFSSSSRYDLALFDLFSTWRALHKPGDKWRICLAWDVPLPNDPIWSVLIQLSDGESLLPGTTCYKFNCDILWPKNGDVLASWRSLREWSKSRNRSEFREFLDLLILEVNCPKSTLLLDYSAHLEKLLARTIETIGVGIYPNDHLNVPQVAEGLCTITRRKRASSDDTAISCNEIAQQINLKQTYGGVEQKFPIDQNVLVATPDRLNQVISALDEHHAVILTAEPGAGKSWFIENLQNHLEGKTHIVKHYCYTALEDPLALKRITINVLFGSLMTQILKDDEGLGNFLTKKYASNLEQLNILLGKIQRKTLLIVDGIDHIWRVYQKNRGGLTEDETKIIQALAQLDLSNPNISLLIISQPIDQLATLNAFYQCTLAQLPESFVQELLEKHAIPNNTIEGISLSQTIHEKSNGNALYSKYLIDHATTNKAQVSFDWIKTLPSYDFNLTSYYQYLYEQIQGDASVPHAFCGADFSLTEEEIKEITHLGNLASTQLASLKPILKFSPTLGYSIYHESFKRFVIDAITAQGASINRLIYYPLIEWLEKHPFYESIKAYGHLLRLYYEVDSYTAIAKLISVDFIDNSLFHAQPFHYIKQNHLLQKAVVHTTDSFTSIIIIAEQSKIIYEIEHNIADQVLIKYLKAIQKIHGDDEMYRVLWDGENLIVDQKDALRFLVNQTYQREATVHWSIIPNLPAIPYEILGLLSIKLLQTKQYKEFDELVKNIYEDPEHKKAFDIIFNEVEWYFIYLGSAWIDNTPYFQSLLTTLAPSFSKLESAIEDIISNDKYIYKDDWEITLRGLVKLAQSSSDEDIEKATDALSQYNWFRNWLIYLIKITKLAQREYSDKEVIDAFAFLVRDLEPFKGQPRACDLYTQQQFIIKSFHWGLLLCKGNIKLLTKCCELLEKVTSLTTSFQRAYSGPLTHEQYLETIATYLPGEYVNAKYKEYYDSLGSGRVYANVAEIAFEYAYVLGNAGKYEEAKKKYIEGVQALTAYGFRKDRTFSEVLYPSVPYQKTYKTLGVEWFFELYHMAMTVVTHTDGRSTSNYPIEWFGEFIKVYPDEALRFLVSETIESNEVNWHQEDEFHHILENCSSLFRPTQWFLLCKSLPLVSSDKIVDYGLRVADQIDNRLAATYSEWLKSRPFITKNDEGDTYTSETASQFEKLYGIPLKFKEESKTKEVNSYTDSSQPGALFPTTSANDALVFLEANHLQKDHAQNIQQLLSSISDIESKKELLRQAAMSFRLKNYGIGVEKWIEDLFEKESFEWLYFSVCLFVYLHDGWFHGLHHIAYIKRAYELNPAETINILKEILSLYISNDNYPKLISGNLISALSEIKVEEPLVNNLLQTTYQIVKRRLPHPPNSEINEGLYHGLSSLNRDEMVVAILIARLKTLTTEKTQGIIWSLTYIARTEPTTLIKPYMWAFSHQKYLLPIQRAVLLQILQEYVDQSLIPDALIGKLLTTYPTGYFLEDQYIRSFVEYRIELNDNPATPILFAEHEYDESFFSYIHPKYRKLVEHIGALRGTYNAYKYRRDKISEEHKSYSLRTEGVVTPIVSNANAAYEIVNSQYYDSLKELTTYFQSSYCCDLRFFLEEIILQNGALINRPSYLPTPEHFPLFEVRDASSPLKQNDWVILASQEIELFGADYKPKMRRSSSCVLTFNEPVSGGQFYAKYLFRANHYFNNIKGAPFDQPICILTIMDTLERSSIIFLSPFIMRELDLKVDPEIHNGFQVLNDKGEIIIKLATWKSDYFGNISDGTEVPRLEGAAVFIKADYYNKLLGLYQNTGHIILSQNADDE
jgi:hypothetical protein